MIDYRYNKLKLALNISEENFANFFLDQLKKIMEESVTMEEASSIVTDEIKRIEDVINEIENRPLEKFESEKAALFSESITEEIKKAFQIYKTAWEKLGSCLKEKKIFLEFTEESIEQLKISITEDKLLELRDLTEFEFFKEELIEELTDLDFTEQEIQVILQFTKEEDCSEEDKIEIEKAKKLAETAENIWSEIKIIIMDLKKDFSPKF